MKSRIVALTLSASLASFSLFATAIAAEPPAKGDAAAGATKAAVCGACHGATGNSVNPEWPSLAGQHHGYISEQLALLKAGVRVAPVMAPMAMALSNEDMADLGAYFEQQTPAGLEANADLWQAGEKLYRGGDTTRSIPGCLGCHGPNGRGNGPAHWPQIRSQQSGYVVNQLKNYAANARYVAANGQQPPANAQIMQTIALRLSDADMKALAAYLQGLR
jgi:cytochrome c553